MYVAVKGGETAIAHSLDLIADKRRGDRASGDAGDEAAVIVEQQRVAQGIAGRKYPA